jgi:hypothetical protein
MSELHRAVEAEIDAFRPGAIPPVAFIKCRKRARDRRRYALSGAALSLLAVAAVVLAANTLAGDGGRLPSYADPSGDPAPGEPAPLSFHITYRDDAAYSQDRDKPQIDRCFALPGVGRVDAAYSMPPQYTVTVRGEAEVTGFRNCLGTLGNVNAQEAGRGTRSRASAAQLLLTPREADEAESGYWQRIGEGDGGTLLDPCNGGTPYPRDRERREQAGVELTAEREVGATELVQQAALYRSSASAAAAFDDLAAAVARCPERADAPTGGGVTRHEIAAEEVRDGVRSLLVRQDGRCPGCSPTSTYYVVQQVEDAVAVLRVTGGRTGSDGLSQARAFADVLAQRLAAAVRS